jgi:hypothetical protein
VIAAVEHLSTVVRGQAYNRLRRRMPALGHKPAYPITAEPRLMSVIAAEATKNPGCQGNPDHHGRPPQPRKAREPVRSEDADLAETSV